MPRRKKRGRRDHEQSPPASGDSITVGDVRDSEVIAVGRGARAEKHVHHHYLQTEPKPRFSVPFPRNPRFVGRDDELWQLHNALQVKASQARPVMLSGMGGIGKTQLTVEYAYRHEHDYPGGVYWVNAAQDWLIDLAARAEEVGLQLDDNSVADRHRRLSLALADFLNQHPDALIIFDNVEDPRRLQDAAHGFVPSQLKCRVLFTTRRREAGAAFAALEVKILSQSAAVRLLVSLRPQLKPRDMPSQSTQSPELEAAESICSALGNQPLALALAAAYLGKHKSIPLSDYNSRIMKEGGLQTVDAAGLEALDLPTRHAAAVAVTLHSQWSTLEDENARLLLRIASLLGNGVDVPITDLATLSGLEAAAQPGYPSPLDEALATLHELSLVEMLADRIIRVHPLVCEFIRHNTPTQALFASDYMQRLLTQLQKQLHNLMMQSEASILGNPMATLQELYNQLSLVRRVQDYTQSLVPDHTITLTSGLQWISADLNIATNFALLCVTLRGTPYGDGAAFAHARMVTVEVQQAYRRMEQLRAEFLGELGMDQP